MIKPKNVLLIFFKVVVISLLLNSCSDFGEPDPTALDLDRKRGCMVITEVNWAGSINNSGNPDPDDDFLELNNRDCNKPVDLTGWRLVMEGDIVRTYIVPEAPDGKTNIIQPSETRVLIAKADGAFRANTENSYDPIHVPGMYFPERNFTIETYTAENFLIENAINNPDGLPLAGGTDGITVRSMERTDDNFDEEGTSITSWHSFTPCNEKSTDEGELPLGTLCADGSIGITGKNVHSDYTQRTFASPGESNTPQYK